MNRFKAAYQLLVGRRKAAELTLTDYAGWETLGGGPTWSGMTVRDSTVLEMTTSWRCIRLISETIGTLPLHLYRRTSEGRERATDHKLYRLVHFQPNPYMTAIEWKEAMAVSLCVWGQAYNDVTRLGSRVTGIMPVPKTSVTPKINPDGELVFNYTNNGVTEKRDRNSICPVKGFGGSGRLEGFAPHHFHKNSIGLSLAAEKYGAEFFEKGMRPSGVFSGDKWPTPEQAQNFEDMFKRRDGKPLFVGGGHKYERMTSSNSEAQFMELREFQIKETGNIWGVSPDMLGVTGGQTYSNVEQRNIQFLTYTLTPYLARIEQALSSCLLTRTEQKDLYLEFDVNGLLRGDSKARAEYYRTMRMISAMTPNEVRESENRDKAPGGDDLHAPLNMAPLDLLRGLNESDGDNNADI